jgi:hypothetical protein
VGNLFKKLSGLFIFLLFLSLSVACNEETTQKQKDKPKTVLMEKGNAFDLNYLLSFYKNVNTQRSDEVGIQIKVGNPPNEKILYKFLRYRNGVITYKNERKQEFTCTGMSFQEMGRPVQYVLNGCKGKITDMVFFNTTKDEFVSALNKTDGLDLSILQ